MQLLPHASVVNIMRNTLNYVDTRLTNHGSRVSYLVYQMLRTLGVRDEVMLRDACILALLHDIGAYKSEEIDEMIEFEVSNIWDHSIWGYLFLSHFSPLGGLAEAVLYHHADYSLLSDVSPEIQTLSQVLHLCDRADTFMMQYLDKGYGALKKAFDRGRDTRYRGDLIDAFFQTHPVALIPTCIDADYQHLLCGIPYSPAEIEAYLEMNILAIDFRSHHTATHTVTTCAASQYLAQQFGMDARAVQEVSTGAMLHDLGKTGVPVEILEHPGRLSPQAMQIMKQHVLMTESILRGNVDDTVLKIAIRHHEKLDGSGYPFGLMGEDLTLAERIVAVADIVSALYEVRSYKQSYAPQRIMTIIEQMAEQGLLDRVVVQCICGQFDDVARAINEARNPIVDNYDTLQAEYRTLKKKLDPHPSIPDTDPTEGDGYRHLR